MTICGLNTFRIAGLAQDFARANPGELNHFAKVGLAGGHRDECVVKGRSGVPLEGGKLQEAALGKQHVGLAAVKNSAHLLFARIVSILDGVRHQGGGVRGLEREIRGRG